MLALATNPCPPSHWSCSMVWQVTGNERTATVTDQLVSRFGSVIVLIVVVVVARWLLHRLIDRFVQRSESGWLPGRVSRMSLGSTSLSDAIGLSDPAVRERRTARARTVGSLLKSIVSALLFTVLFIMVLAELGFSIAPLLTSAGIVGVALGFGAQALVKDFLSGIFMILEDQYGVGDVINLGDPVVGTVEAVTLRVTRLRDHTGVVWFVRNGEILRVGNKSQNWSRAIVDVSVAYTEDVARVRRTLEEVAESLWTDEEFRGVLLESPDVGGIESMAADAVTLQVAVTTTPGQQAGVARALRDRIKTRFADDGVEVTSPSP